MHWIRIAVEKESDTVCRFILVAAQALRATFNNQDNDPGFNATPLEAGVISKLAQPDSAVKKIEQPFTSFGGRGKELPADYYTRVSERLRHKDRAIALWDYERLVLEAFPQIYKVKCLNHTHYEPNENGTGIYRELAAGHVTVVTIPNQQFQNLRDPLRPYTSLGLLLEIDTFLRQRTTCFAKLHVKSPQFEEIRLDFRVRFMTGFDETYYTNQLRLEITRYLSPWAFPGGGSPSFGGKIFKSVLINFVEERPYVDYVTDFKLFLDIGGTKSAADLNEAEGSTAVSVLVSAPEEEHRIVPITVAGLPAIAQVSGEDCSCKQ
ncbi:MAG: baseplate J/gp47 family protein [Lewinellaceae bacterium]|nr:baseplate J/gp47 family protein [Lewinellaceae bacterium]